MIRSEHTYSLTCRFQHIRIKRDILAYPQDFWINTSSNDLVRRFIEKADDYTRIELEKLITGESVSKKLRLELTYDEIDNSIDHLWSVLFTTGYLTQDGMDKEGRYLLKIPNHELRDIFMMQIQEWFKERIECSENNLRSLCDAFENGHPSQIESILNDFLSQSISILDTKAPVGKKENFYHGLLLGMLRSRSGWSIVSNQEAGEGFADLIAYSVRDRYGFIIEVKYADSFRTLEKAAGEGLEQIVQKNYPQYLLNEGIEKIHSYGIAFCKKRCAVAASLAQ